MRIKQYWLVLSRRWWLIAIVTAVATASSIGFAYMQTPVYRSEVKLTVSPSRLDYGLTLVIENLLRQYSHQLQTNKIRRRGKREPRPRPVSGEATRQSEGRGSFRRLHAGHDNRRHRSQSRTRHRLHLGERVRQSTGDPYGAGRSARSDRSRFAGPTKARRAVFSQRRGRLRLAHSYWEYLSAGF